MFLHASSGRLPCVCLVSSLLASHHDQDYLWQAASFSQTQKHITEQSSGFQALTYKLLGLTPVPLLGAAALREATTYLGFSHKQLHGQPLPVLWHTTVNRSDSRMEHCQTGDA